MNGFLVAAAVVVFSIGTGHSYLGERLIFAPLFARTDLPALLGSQSFLRNTLRFAWHITTLLLWCLGVLLLLAAPAGAAPGLRAFLLWIALGQLACAVLTAVISRGRHFAWGLFLAAAVLVALGAR